MKTLPPRLVVVPKPRLAVLDGKAGATPRLLGSSWMKTRARILKRDGYLCQHCIRLGRPVPATEVDHTIPLEQGGSGEDSNLQSLCHQCHATKTTAEQRARYSPTGTQPCPRGSIDQVSMDSLRRGARAT